MSTGQIEQFYSRASSDPAILNKLMADTQTPDEFIDKAVALGAEAGFTFSRDEADAWIKKQIEAKASGELSDLQLEGVAGGKGVQHQRCQGELVDHLGLVGAVAEVADVVGVGHVGLADQQHLGGHRVEYGSPELHDLVGLR